MAGEAGVEVHGYRELVAGSAVLFRRIDAEADARMRDVAESVAGVVRGRVPHLTGRLASSVLGEEAQGGARVGMGGGGVPYAGWIEFGGGHGRPYVAAGRYLTPTATSAEPLVTAAANVAAQTAIRSQAWPRPI